MRNHRSARKSRAPTRGLRRESALAGAPKPAHAAPLSCGAATSRRAAPVPGADPAAILRARIGKMLAPTVEFVERGDRFLETVDNWLEKHSVNAGNEPTAAVRLAPDGFGAAASRRGTSRRSDRQIRRAELTHG
jgi:hypothetical protein